MVYKETGAAWVAATSSGGVSLVMHKVTASGSETSFAAGTFTPTLSYEVNNIIVWLNGVKLDATDYTATSGTSITGLSAVAASDELVVLAFKTFEVADAVSAASGGTFGGAVTFGAGFTVTDESTDTSCYPLFVTAATGSVPPKTGTNLTFNSNTGILTATGFAGPITGAVTGNADTATTATTATNVTVADESSDTTCFPLFVTAATGGLPPRSGTNLTFNSSTGILTATGFAGPITGAVTGNASTATALASGRTIGMTGDVVWTSPSFDGSGNVTATATIQANSVALGTDTTGDYTATVTAGTGLTSTGATSGEGIAHSLSVDAAQTQITSVGTIGTGTWQGTAVAQTYIADQAINEAKLQVSNAPTNGYVLTARAAATGDMTWEAVDADAAGSAIAMAIALG